MDDIIVDDTKIYGFQKFGFVELVVLEARQGAKKERDTAGYVLDKLAVFWGEGGGTVSEPGVRLSLGMSDKAVRKSENILWSFLCRCEIHGSQSVFHPHYDVSVHQQKH